MLDHVSDTCQCEDDYHDPDGCPRATQTFIDVGGVKVTLCGPCSKARHMRPERRAAPEDA